MSTRNSYDGGNLFSQVKKNGADDGRHNGLMTWVMVTLGMIVAVSVAIYFL